MTTELCTTDESIFEISVCVCREILLRKIQGSTCLIQQENPWEKRVQLPNFTVISAEEGNQSLSGFIDITVVKDQRRSLVCCHILKINLSFH